MVTDGGVVNASGMVSASGVDYNCVCERSGARVLRVRSAVFVGEGDGHGHGSVRSTGGMHSGDEDDVDEGMENESEEVYSRNVEVMDEDDVNGDELNDRSAEHNPSINGTPGVVPDMSRKSPVDYYRLFVSDSIIQHIPGWSLSTLSDVD